MNIHSVSLLFAMLLLCCTGCGEKSAEQKAAERKAAEQRAIVAIEASEGMFINDYSVLYLGNTQVTDAGLEHLTGLTGLRTLSVDSEHLIDTKTEHLKGIARLKQFCAADTPIENAGLEHLKRLTKLKELYIPNSKITDEGFQKLKVTLPDCSIVRHKP